MAITVSALVKKLAAEAQRIFPVAYVYVSRNHVAVARLRYLPDDAM